jgi:hypothetical protein
MLWPNSKASVASGPRDRQNLTTFQNSLAPCRFGCLTHFHGGPTSSPSPLYYSAPARFIASPAPSNPQAGAMPTTAFFSVSPSPWCPRPTPRRSSFRVRLPPPRSSGGGGGGGEEPTTTSWVSPDWLTSLSRGLGRGDDDSGIPAASAKLDDVQDLLGGALFLPLFKWFREEGPVYRLAAGPRNFVIVSDPAVAKHVLRGYGSRYEKGLVKEVSEFLFGSGFATAEGALWTVSVLGPLLAS